MNPRVGFKIPSKLPPASGSSSKIWMFSPFIWPSLIKKAAADKDASPEPTK